MGKTTIVIVVSLGSLKVGEYFVLDERRTLLWQVGAIYALLLGEVDVNGTVSYTTRMGDHVHMPLDTRVIKIDLLARYHY